jgi:RNA polymerase sigma-70 factor, ECF subfamily
MAPADPLVLAAQQGDRQALDQLLRREQPRIHALCRRMTGNAADALDATQEALIALVRGLPRYDGRAAFSTWAYRVATNACLDELRRRGRRPVPVDEIAPPASGGGPDLATTVTDHLVLDDALAALSPEFRAPLVLRDVLGLDYAAIAEVLELPPGTVRSRIARARGHLADHLEAGGVGAGGEPARPPGTSDQDPSATSEPT